MRSGAAAPLRLAAFFLALAGPASGSPSPGGDWPQWRGPHRDGSAPAPALAGELPDRLTRLWEREVGGGYSGPVVAGDRVWVHSREGGREVVRGLRLGDGTILWSRSYGAPFRQDDDALEGEHGQGPYATPAVADHRLFTFGINAVLSVWHAETGELLWRKESAEEFDPSFPYFGAAASPLVWRDLCFVHLGGHERGPGDNPSRGAMVALEVASGRERWRWSGDGPSLGASPVIHRIDGRPHLVFKTTKLLVGLDPATGEELWRQTYRVAMDNTIVTPLLLGDRLVTSDFDHGILAWRIGRSGASWGITPLWAHRDASLFTSSPVVAGGLVVGLSHFRRGHFFVLDPESGQVLWRGDPRSGEHASLISAAGRVLAIQDDGTLFLAAVSRHGLSRERAFRVEPAAAWAHPALVGDLLVFRESSRLVAARLEPRGQ